MASILTAHAAPVSSLQPAAPAVLDHVVKRCLNKIRRTAGKRPAT